MLDDEAYTVFNSGEFHKMKHEHIQLFVDNGLLLEENIDEMQIYQHRRKLQVDRLDCLNLFITTTRKCNCSCKYCFQGKKNEKNSVYSSEKSALKIRKFVERLYDKYCYNSMNIDFFGGEPFVSFESLKREMTYYNKWAASNGIKPCFRIYTNGTILSEEKAEFLSHQPVSDLQITLDGPKKIHDSNRPMRNGKSSYESIVGNLIHLQDKAVPFIIRINFDKNSVKYYEDLLDDLNNRGLSGISVYPYAVQVLTQACSEYEAAISDSDLIKMLPQLWETAIKKGFSVPLRPTAAYVYCCASNRLSFIVDPTARLFKCALLQEDNKYQVGFINENGEVNEWAPEYERWFSRNPLEFEKCKCCKLLPVCGGGCSGRAVSKYGTYFTSNCFEHNMYLFKKKLNMYVKYYLTK